MSNKFKAGDKVQYTEGGRGMAAKTGATATVKGYTDRTEWSGPWLNVEWDRNDLSGNQMDGGYNEADFELVTKFKVGDTVRLDVKQSYDGDTGRVTWIEGDLFRADWSNGCGNNMDFRVSAANKVESEVVEPVVEESVVPDEVVQVGDTVECTSADNQKWFTVGKTYIVERVSGHSDCVFVKDNDGDVSVLGYDEYKKVEPKPRFVVMWVYGTDFHPTYADAFTTREAAEAYAKDELTNGDHTEGTLAVFELVGKFSLKAEVVAEPV